MVLGTLEPKTGSWKGQIHNIRAAITRNNYNGLASGQTETCESCFAWNKWDHIYVVKLSVNPHTCLIVIKEKYIFLTPVSDLFEANKYRINHPHTCLIVIKIYVCHTLFEANRCSINNPHVWGIFIFILKFNFTKNTPQSI